MTVKGNFLTIDYKASNWPSKFSYITEVTWKVLLVQDIRMKNGEMKESVEDRVTLLEGSKRMNFSLGGEGCLEFLSQWYLAIGGKWFQNQIMNLKGDIILVSNWIIAIVSLT